MKLFTLGFTKKSAETFFQSLRSAGVKSLLDIRLHNTSQLAGFTKKDDLRYFVKEICGIEYQHLPELAPTAEILGAYREGKAKGWPSFEKEFVALIRSRQIEKLSQGIFESGCLLCGEEKPDHCHRRLVAEYLQEHWRGVHIEHLK